MTLSLEKSKIKQPEPNIVNNTSPNQGSTQKTYNRPYVGVVTPAKISTTPLQDMISLKKQENPHTVYKLNTKNHKLFSKWEDFLPLGVLLCGITSSIALLFKKK